MAEREQPRDTRIQEDSERLPRPARTAAIAVIALLALAILLLATGIVKMSPVGGP